MSGAGRLWLASASPRRRRLLEEAGISVIVHPADLDDAALVRGRDTTPRAWTMALAWFKARRVHEQLGPPAVGTILAADTVCVVDGEILGQPRDEADARRMLCALRGRDHRTVTGVCVLDRTTGARRVFWDEAVVRVGRLDDATIDAYVASGGWRGKAGAYNLADRIGAGWPITCEGDPATVMGLPMRRLAPLLHDLATPVEARRS
jgi:septum formation protein